MHKIIDSLKDRNSSGYDEITTKIIKISKPYIISPLINITNKMLAQSIYPKRLKLSLIKPIYKSGDKSSPSNYRPISILPVFPKIFEKVICNRLIDHYHSNVILNEQQYGSQSEKSTENASYVLLWAGRSDRSGRLRGLPHHGIWPWPPPLPFLIWAAYGDWLEETGCTGGAQLPSSPPDSSTCILYCSVPASLGEGCSSLVSRPRKGNYTVACRCFGSPLGPVFLPACATFGIGVDLNSGWNCVLSCGPQRVASRRIGF